MKPKSHHRRSHNRRSRRRRTLLILSLVDAAALLLLWLLEDSLGERHWLTTALAYVPQWPFGLPWLVLFILSLFGRNVRALTVNLLAGLFFAVALLGFRYHVAPAPAGRLDLRVMTYNIHGGRGGIDRVLSVIRRENPDVVCLQEARPEPGDPDPRPALQRGLPGYWTVSASDLWTATRLPLARTAAHRHRSHNLWRTVLQTDVKWKGRPISVFNTHFTTKFRDTPKTGLRDPAHWSETGAVRQAQAEEIIGWTGAIRGPVLVVGDFNLPPHGRVYRELTRAFTDAFDASGRGLGMTYPSDRPMLRIDHIFSRGLSPVRCDVPAVRASDHRPVVTDLALPLERKEP